MLFQRQFFYRFTVIVAKWYDLIQKCFYRFTVIVAKWYDLIQKCSTKFIIYVVYVFTRRNCI